MQAIWHGILSLLAGRLSRLVLTTQPSPILNVPFHVPTKNTAEFLINLYKKTNQVEKIPTAWQHLVSSLPKDNPDYWWAEAQLAELDQDWSSAAGYYGKAQDLSIIRIHSGWLRVMHTISFRIGKAQKKHSKLQLRHVL